MTLINEILQGRRIGRYIPIIGWVRSYQRAWLRDDLVSGVVVGAIMIPAAMAYAQMAGVPVQAGLYAALVGMTAYAIFATSRRRSAPRPGARLGAGADARYGVVRSYR